MNELLSIILVLTWALLPCVFWYYRQHVLVRRSRGVASLETKTNLPPAICQQSGYLDRLVLGQAG